MGTKTDNKSNFDNHIDEISKKARQKLNAPSSITLYMDLPKQCMLRNAFFLYQFSSFPLVWQFHDHGNNNKINQLRERCLRIIYSDKKSVFIELLEKDNSAWIHKRNLHLSDCNVIRTHYHYVRKQTLNHLAKLGLLENRLIFDENKTLCIFVQNYFSEKKNNYIALQVRRVSNSK